MKLAMEQATIGYSRTGVNSLMENIKANVIDDATKQMEDGLKDLEDAIDAIWVGKSAEQFKENMRNDNRKLRAAMQQVYLSINGETKEVGRQMAHVDEQLVEKRA
ncbi:hypothetical protein IKQ74_02515 [Candidatus Saccharibacteria bacterium]|nr:hypothetical protein [Candidatus Saccharibacteria bacterium]